MSRSLVLLLAAVFTTVLCTSCAKHGSEDVTVALSLTPGAGRLATGWGSMGPASDPINGQWDLSDETVAGVPDTLSDLHVRFIDFQWENLLLDAYLHDRIDSVDYYTYHDRTLNVVAPPEPFDQHVHYAVGRDKSENFVVVFDTDNDEDLSDEESVTFPWDGPPADLYEFAGTAMSSSREFLRLFGVWPRFVVSTQLFDGERIVEAHVPISIVPNVAVKRQTSPDEPPVEAPAYLIGTLANMVGTTTIGDSVYTFWAAADLGAYSPRDTHVWFESGNQVEAPVDSTDPFAHNPYLIGQVIEAGDRFFRLDDISLDGSSLNLVEVDGKPGAGIRGGMEAPDFKSTAIDGGELSLAGFRGRYVLLDFWGTKCGPCLEGLPDLKSVYSSFSRDRFEIVGIAQDDPTWLRQFVSDNGIEWPQVTQDRSEDGAADILDAYRVTGIPSYFLIDPDGRLLDPAMGIYPNELGETLRKLMD